jgi:hypothetical protein
MTRSAAFLLTALALFVEQTATAQQTECARDTREIVTTPEVRRTSRKFLASFTSECNSGLRPDLCEKPVYDATKLSKGVTRIMNYTALEGTTEFLELADACREHNYVPVQIDDEMRYKSVPGSGKMDTRILGIGLLHCLPASCANDFNDIREAYYHFEDDMIRQISERVDFRRDTAPDNQTDTTCDLQSAEWSKWSGSLKDAFNNYVARINIDCSSSQQKDYCRTLYRSLGEFNAQTLRLHKSFDTDEFQAYAEACANANGDICAFDMTLSFQGARTSNGWWKEDRADVNHVFLGYPECYSRTCSYEEKASLTEYNHLNQMLKKFANRRLREVSSSDATPQGGSLDEIVSQVETTVSSGDMPAIATFNEADHPLSIQARFVGVDAAMYDDIPEASFLDYIHEKSEASSTPNPTLNRKLYKMYEGKKKCGINASRCYSRLSNFCLRRK